MQQILSTPVLRHVRRPLAHTPMTTPASDLRWHLLDLVRRCRSRLALRDRDIAVLRGLLSLLPASASQRMVFASNRVLIDRCDGIDERTLRRRLAHLESKGLLARRHSPNGKRYRVRDAENVTQLAYGLDLEPLFAIQSHLEALAEDCAREGQRIAVLKARLRDALYHAGPATPPDLAEECRLSLRRTLTSERLQALLQRLLETAEVAALPSPTRPETPILTASDGQNDRHIQSSDKESLNKKQAEKAAEDHDDLTVAECMDLAPSARAMATEKPRSWHEVIQLSALLGPAIGLDRPILQEAEARLGPHGSALAIIGLVEAFDRIRNPGAYLRALLNTARDRGLNLCRMFRSLAKPPSDRRQRGGACIPG